MKKNLIILLAFSLLIVSCSSLTDFYKSMNQLKDLEYKIESVENYRLSSISLKEIKKVTDFNFSQGLNLLNSFKKKSMDFSCLVNLAVSNPNPASSDRSKSRAVIKQMNYRVYFDNKIVLSGAIEDKLIIPAGGELVIIPISVKFNIFEIFKDMNYKELMKFIFSHSTGGENNKKIELEIDATIDTPLGEVNPGWIKVLSK